MWSKEANREFQKNLNAGCVEKDPHGTYKGTAGSVCLPFSNIESARDWWKKCKDKNGFRILAKIDRRILDMIVTEKINSL